MKRTINDQRYSVKKFPSVGYLFWVLNPILAINELILGQRIPRETLVESDVQNASIPREFIECEACGQLTDLERWPQAGIKFGNWFGLACPNCGSKLPTCLNLWSRLLLLAVFPIAVFLRSRFQNRALSQQVLILRGSTLEQASPDGAMKSLKLSALFGLGMAFVLFLASLVQLVEFPPSVIIGLIGGGLSGLTFGGIMHVFARKI